MGDRSIGSSDEHVFAQMAKAHRWPLLKYLRRLGASHDRAADIECGYSGAVGQLSACQ